MIELPLMNAFLQPIHDATILATVDRQLQTLLTGSYREGFRLHKHDQWCAVPVESACHFNNGDCDLLAAAIGEQPEPLLACALEPLTVKMQAFHVAPTTHGLTAFSQHCGLFNYALFPPTGAWLVLCTTDDYYALVGPASFVTTALGSSITTGYATFRHFVESPEFAAHLP
jgi:hypothetical protein